jgi:hypothetical protein
LLSSRLLTVLIHPRNRVQRNVYKFLQNFAKLRIYSGLQGLG